VAGPDRGGDAVKRLEARWRWRTGAVCVATGMSGASGADIGVWRDAAGRPRIPASTLKGALRASAALWAGGIGLAVCSAPLRPCPVDRPPGRDWSQPVCPVCQLFGSPWQPSPLRLFDAVLERAEERTSVRMDQVLGRAASGGLFRREVARGGEIEAHLEGDNLDPAALGLLVGAGRLLWQIGGGKSRGLGTLGPPIAERFVADGELLTADHLTAALDALARAAQEGSA
jgi:CRISPR/Cas system CSM-associated protein Csm3 (group 7 of RAMP superfamily)